MNKYSRFFVLSFLAFVAIKGCFFKSSPPPWKHDHELTVEEKYERLLNNDPY